LLVLLANHLNLTIQIVNVYRPGDGYENVMDDLVRNRTDVFALMVAVTKKRAEKFDFTRFLYAVEESREQISG
jgi:phage-related protein